MPKVAITDFTFPSLDVEEAILRPLGAEVVSGQCKSPETLIPLVAHADAVITQFAPISAIVIEAMERARVIVRYGIGVDNVDLKSARRRGIPVCNVPTYCIDEVADHTLAFILAMTRQVVANAISIRAGNWGLATPLTEMKVLRDQTVGIVGFGRIGQAVAARLAAFRSRRLVFDPLVEASHVADCGCEPVSFDVLLSHSNILTLHCPSTPKTRHLINAESMARLPRGAILINVARGDIVDTGALLAALNSGQLAMAAIDVAEIEPIPSDSPLRSMPNVIASSHVASASVAAVKLLRETAAQIAAAALRGERLPNIVNGVV